MQQAVSSWRKGAPIYAHATKFGVNASALYRALKRLGKLKRKNGA